MSDFRRPALWMLIALAAVLWVGQYALRGLWAPDEARYAYVAREMRESGEWLVMHVNGGLYPDKPPLLFWLINAAALPAGGTINSLTARLPSLLGMILALWAVARLAERWAGPTAAWRAALVTMTSYLIWWEGGWGRIDALLLGLVMAALYHLFSYNDDGLRWRPLAAYLLLGLATLAKGPVALAVALGSYLVATLATGEGGKLRRWHWAWGIPLALAFIGAWLAAARWLGGAPDDYFARMFGVKFLGRIAQAEDHANPIFYYLAHFPLEFLPWTIFLPAAYRALGPGTLRRRLLGWGLFILVLFSAFSGKRQMYILALYPAAALLVAAAWPGFATLPRRWSIITGRTAVGLYLFLGIVVCAAVATLVFTPSDSALGLKIAKKTAGLDLGSLGWRLALVGPPLLGAAWWLLRVLHREGLSSLWFRGYASTTFALWVVSGTLILPLLNPVKAPLAFIPHAQARLAPTQPVHLYRHQLAIIPLYLERPGRELWSPEEIETLLRSHASGLIVFQAHDWAELAPRFTDRLLARPMSLGGKRLIWAEFPVRPPASAHPVSEDANTPAIAAVTGVSETPAPAAAPLRP